MKFYLASISKYAEELEQIRFQLEQVNHVVVSEWHKSENVRLFNDHHLFEIYRAGWAMKDVRDIKKCDILVHRNPDSSNMGKGGSHVEFGAAYALGKIIVVIGSRENVNVFQYLPGIIHFEEWEQFFKYLQDLAVGCPLLQN